MSSHGWSLEVVRGREVGRLYAVTQGETVLGNALNGSPGLNLADQEGGGPRQMAGRQARLDCSGPSLTLRDLDSPGGTFVNRQRLLPGQVRPLQPGDLIQLGGVQLKVVEAGRPLPAKPAAPASAAPAPKPAPRPAVQPASGPSAPAAARSGAGSGPLSRPFVLATGVSCRTWDDFLTVSAQRWASLRDELVSGRLAGFLASLGHADLAPSPTAAGTPDERLDAWLAALPTTRPSQPELDVHPATIAVRAASGGGTTRQVLRITNTGYRLLRTTVRVDPSAASWIRVAPEFAGRPFVTVESTEVPLEVHIPEVVGAAMTGLVVIEGNGGTRTVSVQLERLPPPESIPEVSAALYGVGGPNLVELVERQPAYRRLVLGSAGGVALRLLVAVGSLLPFGRAAEAFPRLSGSAVVFAALASAAAAVLASRRGERRDVPAAGFAGGFAGLLLAALVVAACRAIEPVLGTALAQSLGSTAILWAGLGAGLAGLSLVVLPPARPAENLS